MTAQSAILSIDIQHYWCVLEDVIEWLIRNDMLSQARRITDTRLSERLPDGERIVCKRCRRSLVSVPCIECLVATSGWKKNGHDKLVETASWRAMVSGKRLPLAPQATHHKPGTAEKYLVMCARSEAGYSIFHPRDAGK